MDLEGNQSVFNPEENKCCTLKSQFIYLDDNPQDIKCLLCDICFQLPTNEEEFLKHLFETHRLVIGDVWEIASLKSYVHYWRIKFKDEPIINFCALIKMDCTPDGKPSTNEHYFLLSDCLTEDKILREELHQAKLEWVLNEQAKEKVDPNFKRGCLFCRTDFMGSRIEYVKHHYQKHNLNLGKPENLVFLDEYFDKIENLIENLICITCERTFKDRNTLKEHMRKKFHKHVNPHNKSYDKHYISNYLKFEKSQKRKQNRCSERKLSGNKSKENEEEEEEEEDTKWSDWEEENDHNFECLFCKYATKNFSMCLTHISTVHNFNFKNITKDFDFYQKVKMVNYIRKQIRLKHCIYCESKVDDVLLHMKEENHFKLPAQSIWNMPIYYTPMDGNDSFLHYLDDHNSSEEEEEEEEAKWSDWEEENNYNVKCLFCKYVSTDFSTCLMHIRTVHNFNFQNVTGDFDFYQKIKMVVYIRSQISLNRCIYCETEVDDVLSHMKEENHFKLPSQSIWNLSIYCLPMDEDDSFLHYLDTAGNSEDEDTSEK